MKTRIIYLWDKVRTSYWFVPGALSIAALVFSLLTLYLDQHVQEHWVRAVGWIWAGGAEGAREVLSTIASSMITVAGVTFSITIVALQLASSQFGPRVLRNFMSDTGNQLVLGTFIATFLYCLLVLRTVRSTDEATFVPYISITIGLILAVLSLGVLIFFVHHVSQSIRAEFLVAAIASEFEAALQRLYPDREEGAPERSDADSDRFEARFDDSCLIVEAQRSGYLQAVEMETLMQTAHGHELLLRLPRRPGEFITAGQVLVEANLAGERDESVVEALREAFILGRQRTPRQDILYSVNQFAEIAVRALSPGINDPYTAAICVDWLSASLSALVSRPKPVRLVRDEDGSARILKATTSFADIVDAAFNPIRQYGSDSALVAGRLLEAIAAIAAHAHRQEDRETLTRHAGLIARDAKDALPNDQDRSAIATGYGEALEALQRHGGPPSLSAGASGPRAGRIRAVAGPAPARQTPSIHARQWTRSRRV